MLMFFFDIEMESLHVSISRHWQQILLFAGWASFSGVISPWILGVFPRWAQEANHRQRQQCLFPTTLFLPLEGALSTPSLRMWKQTRWVCYLHLLAFSRVSGTKQGSRASWRLAWRERLDGILNKNDRLCFKLNKNKLFEEYIEVACMLPLERFIFICLSMYKGER